MMQKFNFSLTSKNLQIRKWFELKYRLLKMALEKNNKIVKMI